jgi:hypothetical protein
LSEPRTVELWPCGYTARCSAPECRRRASTILRYVDNQERPDHQIDACDTHASELCDALRVIDRKRYTGPALFISSISVLHGHALGVGEQLDLVVVGRA